ncbi:MAG TPA: M20/M25/M40 family metallo-hydrolase [Gemmatimonadaceae bacterium]|nr:M20/M25/M40 family metallo-hydrolase [Gemmatimonadaceae bacterium]
MSSRTALLLLAVPAVFQAQQTTAAPTSSTPTAAVASQPSDDATIDRIFRIGMDSSRLKPLAQALLDSIGPRLTGSPGIASASDWVINTYRSWGIDARREQYGTWRGWRRGASHIDLVSPRMRSLEGSMLAWSPGTNARVVTAEAIVLPKFADSTEFVRWLPQARGKIVLVSPGWPTCRPSEDWIRWATPESKARMDTAVALMQRDWAVTQTADGKPDSARLYRGTGHTLALGTGTLGLRLEKAGVVGMISSRPKFTFSNPLGAGAGQGGRGGGFGGAEAPGARSMRGGGPAASKTRPAGPGGGFGFDPQAGSGGWGVIEVFETYNTTAPAIAMTCEDYGLLYRLAENNQKPVVRLDLTAQLLGEQPAFNTIGVIKGVEKPDEYVMLSAHFDSWDGSSGATDNGTGTLMAMEAMRILKLVYPRPKRTILVGHWASEEQGLNGSRAFTEDHPEVMKGLQALFNQDNGTGRVQSISAAGLTNIGPHLRDWYAKLPRFYTDSMSDNVVSWSFNDRPTGNPGGTDGAVFACYGTPSFGFGSLNWNYGTYTWHTNRDTYDKIVFDDLRHNATLAALMVYLASEDPQFISREKSPGTWPENWPQNCGKAPRKTRPRF